METPKDINAEKYVLGCCLVDNSLIGEIAEILNEKDFYILLHQNIFKAIKKAFSEGDNIDVITANSILSKDVVYQKAGAIKYLFEVQNSVDTIANWQENSKIVKEKSILRNTLNLSYEIQKDVENTNMTSSEILDKVGQEVFKISNSCDTSSLRFVDKDLPEVIRDIEGLYSGEGKTHNIPTGFNIIDVKIGGFGRGELVIIAGRPSMGKSLIAMNIAENVAMRGGCVAVFSLEMTRENLIKRTIASLSETNLYHLMYGGIRQDEINRIMSAQELITKLSELICIDTDANINVFNIRARIRKVVQQIQSKGKRLDMIVIDYLQRMIGDSNLKGRNLQIAEITRQLKNVALEFNIPVVCLSQLNRGSEQNSEKIPMLSNLRDSGAIEQDADKVIFIHREGYYKKDDPDLRNSATLIIGKNRNGEVGDVNLYFEPSIPKFRSL